MPILPRFRSLWRNLIHKDQVERELAEEIHAYRDLLIETKLKEGLTPAEARRLALIELVVKSNSRKNAATYVARV